MITVSEERGVRYLHFGTEWVQGAMRVRKPWDLELDYARHMMAWLLFIDAPRRILQIGLGSGALTKFIHRKLPTTEITVVENSVAVLDVARSHFNLPAADERLELLIEDGETYVRTPSLAARFAVIQLDVFDADARGPALDSPAFYADCARLLAPGGVMVVNLFGDVPSYATNVARIEQAFEGRLLVLPPLQAGNVIALAFEPAREVLSWSRMRAQADAVQARFDLDAHGWVNGLKSARAQGLATGFPIAA